LVNTLLLQRKDFEILQEANRGACDIEKT